MSRELERSGLADDLEESPVYRAAWGWVVTTGRVIGAARDAVPSLSDAADRGTGCFEGLFQ